jgi:hypothetical protein
MPTLKQLAVDFGGLAERHIQELIMQDLRSKRDLRTKYLIRRSHGRVMFLRKEPKTRPVPCRSLPGIAHYIVVDHVKRAAQMNVHERTRQQSGVWNLRTDKMMIDLYVISTVKTEGQGNIEELCLRRIASAKIPSH